MRKHGQDRHVTFGDGGDLDLCYPIWTDTLNFDHTRMKRKFNEISQSTEDWRPDEPIQNLIDPELFVAKIDNIPERLKDIESNMERVMEHIAKVPFAKDAFPNEEAVTTIMARETYAWIPSVIECSTEGARFASPIHNLPMTKKNEELYEDLASLFYKMQPAFHNVISQKTSYQVIVKAQMYEIANWTEYRGHWHVEGLTENIKAVGVYCFLLEDGLTGGKIRFRPANVPEEYYNLGEMSVDIPILEGDCVVFQNILPHRLRELKNNIEDGKHRKRGILTFFLIDPEKPLPITTQNFPSINKDLFLDELENIFDENVANDITEYLPHLMSLEEANELRKASIEEQSKKSGKWHACHFGNSGEVSFIEPQNMFFGANRRPHLASSDDCYIDFYDEGTFQSSSLSDSTSS